MPNPPPPPIDYEQAIVARVSRGDLLTPGLVIHSGRYHGAVLPTTTTATPVTTTTLTTATQAFPLRAYIDGETYSFASLAEKFAFLAEQWRDYNDGMSFVEYNHVAYLQIIGMGRAVVPMLLEELRRGNDEWVPALKYIAGQKVHAPEMVGKVDEIRKAWLEWGVRCGYRPYSG
jgi:hypothetical protein